MSKRLSKHIIADKRFKSRLSHKEEKLRHKIKHEKELLHYAKLEENYRKLHQRLKDSKHPKHKKQLAQASAEIKAHRKRIYKKHPYHASYFATVHKKPVSHIHKHMQEDKEIVEPTPPIDYSAIKQKASDNAEKVVNTVGNAIIGVGTGIGNALGKLAKKVFAHHESTGESSASIPSSAVESISTPSVSSSGDSSSVSSGGGEPPTSFSEDIRG